MNWMKSLDYTARQSVQHAQRRRINAQKLCFTVFLDVNKTDGEELRLTANKKLKKNTKYRTQVIANAIVADLF
jgi:hypothetical protein